MEIAVANSSSWRINQSDWEMDESSAKRRLEEPECPRAQKRRCTSAARGSWPLTCVPSATQLRQNLVSFGNVILYNLWCIVVEYAVPAHLLVGLSVRRHLVPGVVSHDLFFIDETHRAQSTWRCWLDIEESHVFSESDIRAVAGYDGKMYVLMFNLDHVRDRSASWTFRSVDPCASSPVERLRGPTLGNLHEFAITTSENTLWVSGGFDCGTDRLGMYSNGFSIAVYRYIVDSDVWTGVGQLPQARIGHSMCVAPLPTTSEDSTSGHAAPPDLEASADGSNEMRYAMERLFCVGGRISSVESEPKWPGATDCFCVDLPCERANFSVTRKWRRMPPLSVGRLFHRTFVVDGKLVVIGGISCSETAALEVETLDVRSEGWHNGWSTVNRLPDPTPLSPEAQSWHVLMANGTFLVTPDSSRKTNARLYDGRRLFGANGIPVESDPLLLPDNLCIKTLVALQFKE